MPTSNPFLSPEEFIAQFLGVKLTPFQEQYLGQWNSSEHVKLRQLAEDCCRDYDRRCGQSEDPDRPWFPKPGFPSFAQIAKEEVYAHYEEAQCLGFTGSRAAWAQMVYETRPPERERLYAHSR